GSSLYPDLAIAPETTQIDLDSVDFRHGTAAGCERDLPGKILNQRLPVLLNCQQQDTPPGPQTGIDECRRQCLVGSRLELRYLAEQHAMSPAAGAQLLNGSFRTFHCENPASL